MLVLLSDIHLTDGSCGATINPGAFDKFGDYLCDMVEKANREKVANGEKTAPLEVVLLGDIFDVIRSKKWSLSSVRPWTDEKEKQDALEQCTIDIVDAICASNKNIKSINEKDLKKKLKDEKGLDIEVKITYIIGNHDWLINRYPETRRKIADFLGLDNPGKYEFEKFHEDGYWHDYSVYARHGDRYDEFNFTGDRDRSSLGDAVVIELLNRFPETVKKDLAAKGISEPDLVMELEEIDNVRPVLDAPAWRLGKCRLAKSEEAFEIVKTAWNSLVDDFFRIPYIKKQDKWWSPADSVDKLQYLLKISSGLTLEQITSLPLNMVARFRNGSKNYCKRANSEAPRDTIKFILYGHTHDHEMIPLDILPKASGNSLEKMYINTGTWRKVHTKVAIDEENIEFCAWNVMTFVAFYLQDERGEHSFEVWNGALG